MTKPKVVKVKRQVLGITANVRNLLIAIALLFAFLSGFFQVFNWLDTTYAKTKSLIKVEVVNDYRWETIVLNGMYMRFSTLDNVISFSVDPSKIPPETRSEYTELKGKIKLQEEKVKILQEKSCK